MIQVRFKICTLYFLLFISVLTVQAQSSKQNDKVIMVNKGIMIFGENTPKVATLFDFKNTSTANFVNKSHFYVNKDYINEGGEIGYKINQDDENEKSVGTTYFYGDKSDDWTKLIDVLDSKSPVKLYNVVFRSSFEKESGNPIAFDLIGDLNIYGKATFEDGIINNRNDINSNVGLLIFQDGATTEGVNDYSYVNGEVKKLGSDSFEFPIGAYSRDKYYRYAKISEVPSSTPTAAQYFLEETNTSKRPHYKRENTIITINNNEFWYLRGNPDSGLMLTLSWDERTTPNELLKDAESLHIVYWDTDKDKWVDMGGLIESGTDGSATGTVKTRVDKEGIYTLALVDEIKEGEIRVFNAISPNEDGKNDKFYVEVSNKCKCFDKLAVKIYNRWGVQVYGSDNYLSDDANTFYGYSNGRSVVDKGTLLSRGTYYYILEYEFTDDKGYKHNGTKVGYLYIANDPNINGTPL